MKTLSLKITILCFICFTIQNIQAQDYKSSVGVRVGTFFALSYKTIIGEKDALEGIAGINREGGQSIFTVGGFYQRHNQLTVDIPTLRWYYGGGVFLGFGSDEIKSSMTLAGTIGLEYTLRESRINFFLDGIPYISMNNDTDFRFDTEASLGIRYNISGTSQ